MWVNAVQFKNGDVIPADLVVMAAGHAGQVRALLRTGGYAKLSSRLRTWVCTSSSDWSN